MTDQRHPTPDWQRSTRCGESGQCVEVWRKSSYSSESANCVEVADGDQVQVRDSKDPDGPRLTFRPESWTAFLAAIRTGELAGSS